MAPTQGLAGCKQRQKCLEAVGLSELGRERFDHIQRLPIEPEGLDLRGFRFWFRPRHEDGGHLGRQTS